LMGGTGVIMGAFGAHALKALLTERGTLQSWHTAVNYQLFHALALLALCGVASASCPNDCSGNGECNIYSACECYRNWMGADCSERVCYFGVAFVDTPQGDLNSDGFVSDLTYKSRKANDQSSGGWEIYPYYAGWGSVNYQWFGHASATALSSSVTVIGNSKGEAHFYKECSAKGDCDRSSGLCTCYGGYEGAGCTRVSCQNDCSGHGLCRTIDELKYLEQPITSPSNIAAFEYAAWDATITQQCTCDTGWFGLDCSLRECPKGDDPVTKFLSFTRIKFRDTTATKYHDVLDYNTGDSHTLNGSSGGNKAGMATSYKDAYGFVPRIWDGSVVSTSLFLNGYQWNPWYTAAVGSNGASLGNNAAFGVIDAFEGKGLPVLASGTELCTHADTWVCENRGVVFSKTAVAYHFDFVVTGSKSGARGVQRRIPMGTNGDPVTPDTAETKYAPGCCYNNAGTTDCTQCDFFSLYLSEVEGTFQLGDKIQMTWGAQAISIGNYIEVIDTYYNAKIVQREEEQVIEIKFLAAAVASRFQGYFSLTFTDDFGDQYTTEAIEASVSGISKETCQTKRWGAGAQSDSYLCPSAAKQGDFTIYGGASGESPAADPYVAAITTAQANTDDKAGGDAVAAQIEAALEALPNKVTGDVMVEYAYQNNYVTGDGYALKRFFVVRFLEASGDIPEMTVNFAFTAGGKIYTNQGCGAVGEVQQIIVDTAATVANYNGVSPVIVFADAGGSTSSCVRVPKAVAVVQGTGATSFIQRITILDRGSGCTKAQTVTITNGAANGAATAKVVMNRPGEAGTLLTCLGQVGGASLLADSAATLMDPGRIAAGKIGAGRSERTAAGACGVRVMQTYQLTNAAGTALLEPQQGATISDVKHERLWQRSGIINALGVRGTTENVECSNRGTCDYSTGSCQCFTGFTAKDCSVQNALAAGGN